MNIGSLKIKKKEADPVLTFQPVGAGKGKVALVDGDVICFHSCPPRRNYLDENTQKVELDEDGNRKPVVYTEEEEMEYFHQAWTNLKNTLDGLAERLYCDEVMIAIGGVRNFRQDIYPDYKVHRSRNTAFTNHTVPMLRDMLIHKGMAVNALGYEADDLIRIWATQAAECGQDFIICSVDKDLLCIPGQHFLMHKGKEQVLNTDEITAARHYFEQILKGDPTDNIPGIPGVGPKKAEKMLSECKTIREMQDATVEAYFDFYGEAEWYNNLMINGRLIHIMATVDDYFSVDDWPLVKELNG